MYFHPQPYKCIKCGFEFAFSTDHKHPSPILYEETGQSPTCPECWNEFLRKNIGIGYCVVAWNKNGSEYENKLKETENGSST